jgi:rubrerythrin
MNDTAKKDAPATPTPQTLPEFMAHALAMEREAVDRYTQFADALEMHNNTEVAALFRTMAGYEAKHAERIMAEMGWTEAPPVPDHIQFGLNLESPETAPFDEVHYLMQPWHALQLALAAEKRAEAFFAVLARLATNEPVRQAALELQAEEAGHVALVQEWIAKVPPPDPDWANDPDPPRYTD